MSDLIAQTAMFQCDKGGMHKLQVILSPASGDSQPVAAKSNCLLIPQGTPCSLLNGMPCPMVVPITSKEAQKTVEVGGLIALGADCEFQCPMGGKLSAQSHGQNIAKHDEASAGLELASLGVDLIPFVGTLKSLFEVISGIDPVTGQPTSRIASAIGIIPGGKILSKGGKVVKTIIKSEKAAAKTAKVIAKTEKAALKPAAKASKPAAKASKPAAKASKPVTKGNKAVKSPAQAGKPQPHRMKTKALTPNENKVYKQKVDQRTLKKDEWKRLQTEERFKQRRNDGVKQFWKEERRKIQTGKPTSRNWEPHQIESIKQGKVPKVSEGSNVSMQGHHSYSAREYPHLANDPKNITPVTPKEHLQLHGNNFRNPTHGN